MRAKKRTGRAAAAPDRPCTSKSETSRPSGSKRQPWEAGWQDEVSEEARTELSNRQSSVSASEVTAGARPGATAPLHTSALLVGAFSLLPCLPRYAAGGQGFWEGAGSATSKASNPSKESYRLTHRHVNARSLDPCSSCLSPSRLASTLPVPHRTKKLGPVADLRSEKKGSEKPSEVGYYFLDRVAHISFFRNFEPKLMLK